MEEIILDAIERKDLSKFREVGFVAGVLYGDGVEKSTPVKFDEKSLNKVLNTHGSNAKVWININNSKKFGFIKEVQRRPMTRNVTHIDVQIVSKDHEIKMVIPIAFKGEDALKSRQLQLQIHKSDITIVGKMASMPDSIEFDVSEMNLGDTITIDQFNLDKLLKIENEEAVIGAVVNLRILPTEDEVTETETETNTEAK